MRSPETALQDLCQRLASPQGHVRFAQLRDLVGRVTSSLLRFFKRLLLAPSWGGSLSQRLDRSQGVRSPPEDAEAGLPTERRPSGRAGAWPRRAAALAPDESHRSSGAFGRGRSRRPLHLQGRSRPPRTQGCVADEPARPAARCGTTQGFLGVCRRLLPTLEWST